MAVIMSMEAWEKKKKQEEEEKSSSVSTQRTTSDSANTSKTQRTVLPSLETWENTKKYGGTVSGFTKQANSTIKNIQDQYSGWKAKDSEKLSALTKETDDLLSVARSWRNQYANDPAATKEIDSIINSLTGAKEYAQQSYLNYGKFETKEKYNDAVEVSKLYSVSDDELAEKLKDTDNPIAYTTSDGENVTWAGIKESRELNKLYSMDTADLRRAMNESGSDIAYTTQDGKNLTWKSLYDQKKQEEDSAALYADLSSRSDFEQYRDAGANIENPTVREAEGGINIFGWRPGAEKVGNIVTYSRENADEILMGDMNTAKMVGSARYRLMTEQEVDIYNYFLAKEGEEKAAEYLKSLEGVLESRDNQQWMKALQDYATEHPVLASGVSVFQNVGAGAEYLSDTADYLKTGFTEGFSNAEMDRNSLADASSTIRSTVSEDTAWMIGNWDAFDFVYSTAMSGADSLASALFPGKVGGVVLGLSAAAQGTNNALDNGQSGGNAFFSGFFSGVFEGLFESVSIGNFKALKETAATSLKDIAKNVAKSMLVNASEETVTELANIAYDRIVNGDFSEYETAIRMYVQRGMSESDAKLQAALDLGAQVLESGASGALMGVGFGGLGSVSSYRNGATAAKALYGSDSSALVNEALEINPDNTLAQKMQDRLNNNQKVSGGQLARLAQQNEQAILEGDTAKIQQAAAERLTELGETGDIEAISVALTKRFTGEKLTKAEERVIQESKYGRRVSSELNPENIRAGEYSSAWAERIDTNRINAAEYSQRAEASEIVQEAASEQTASKLPAVQNTAQSANPNEEQDADVVSEGKENAAPLVTADTGAEISDVKSVSGEKMVFQTAEGAEVSMNEIAFASEAQAQAYQEIAKISNNAAEANDLIAAYRASKISGEIFAKGIGLAYINGQHNLPLRKADMTRSMAALPKEARDLAYRAGQIAAGYEVEQREAKIQQIREAAGKVETKPGKVYFSASESKGSSEIREYIKSSGRQLTEIQEASLLTMEKLSAAMGVDFNVFESYLNENGERVYIDESGQEVAAPNGFYKDGKIYIDLNAGNTGKGTMLFTVAHELTHFIKEWSPTKYRALADIVVGHLEQKEGVNVYSLIEAQQAKAAAAGRELSVEDAYEEVVADSMESILVDGKVVEMMAEIKQKDQSLWQKIRTWFKNLAADLKKVIDAYKGVKPDSLEGRIVADMRDVYAQLQEVYADALVEGSENFSATQKTKNTADESGVKYSLKEYSDVQKKNWATSKRIIIFNDNVQLAQFIQDSINQKTMDKKMYFGAIPSDLAARIQAETGLNVENYNLSLGSYEVRKILKDHGDTNREAPRGQRAIEPDDFAHIVDIVLNPTKISIADDPLYMGKPAIIFTGNHNGRMNVVAVVSDKRLDLFVQTVYVNVKKEGNLATPTGEQAPINTPEANNGTVSNNSIRPEDEKSNTKFSLRSSVEETKTLVALHNLTEDKLMKSINLGGFPMPSIAVTKSDIPHTNFGEITLVMDKSTIDPKLSKKNVVYSADAWTPVFPRVEYEADSEVENRIYKKLTGLENKIDEFFHRDLRRVKYSFEDNLNRYGGEKELVKSLMDNYGLKAAYLEDTGTHIAAVNVQRETTPTFSDKAIEIYDQIIRILGTDDATKIGTLPLKQIREEHGDQLEAVYPGMTKSALRMGRILSHVRDYLENRNTERTFEMVIDPQATQKAVDDVLDLAAYHEWVENLFAGIEKSSGIYNEKPLFTPSGNRRSFKQTHLPVTLENIVKAMAAQNNGQTKNVSGFNGIKTLRAGAAERFKSIKDMHDREERLQNLTQEEFDRVQNELQERLYAIITKIDDENGNRGESNSFIRFDAIGEIISEISEGASFNVEDINRKFHEYGRDISDETALEIKQLLFDVTGMPVNLFEAKPERVIGFNEVLAAIVPNGISREVRSGLERAGVRIIEYENGNTQDRVEKVNSVDNAKFSTRDPNAARTAKSFERENARLKEDVQDLKDLLKLQKTLTHGQKFKSSTVDKMANVLMQDHGAKGETRELSNHLNSLYEYIAKGEDLTWEEIQEQAVPAAEWIRDHMPAKQDPYAAEVLTELRSRRIRMSEGQKQEAAYHYGSYNDFRKLTVGTTVFTSKKDALTLEEHWKELSESYPDIFPPDTRPLEMPGAFIEALDTLNNFQSLAQSAEQDIAMQDLVDQIYDSYWRVSTLHTVADQKQAEIEQLRSKHRERMDKLKESHENQLAKLKEQKSKAIENLRDSRKRAEMKTRIRRKISSIDKVLNRGSKQRNVKEELRTLADATLEVRQTMYFLDRYTRQDMVRNGVGTDLNDQEEDLLRQAQVALEAGDERKLESLMGKLENVFQRERKRINKVPLKQVFSDIVEAYASVNDPKNPAYIQDAYDEDVYQKLCTMRDSTDGTTVRDMSLEQLTQLNEAYTMVLTTIRRANRLFADNIKATREQMSEAVVNEIVNTGKKRGDQSRVAMAANSYFWNNEKPVYAFERIGSDTMTQLYENIRRGQDTAALDYEEAKDYAARARRKFKYQSWDIKKRTAFETETGRKFDLSLGEMMSIYAYTKRDAAFTHLTKGGIVFPSGTEVVKEKKSGIKRTYIRDSAETYQLSDKVLSKIVSGLTEDQKAYVDSMQKYLSTTMGAKGNEVSMALYGVQLYGEENYFPMRVAPQFKPGAQQSADQQQVGQASLKNAGFTHSTVPEASDPIIIQDFMDTWAGHVAEMSNYHGLVLPLEDFRRVWEYTSRHQVGEDSYSVKEALQNAYGKAAESYLNQLYSDINGGIVSDPRESLGKKLVGQMKKASVFASVSVVIQQPSAIGRAFAEVNPKYFFGEKVTKDIYIAPWKNHIAAWEQLKKYAPVAIIKEMGYFDTDSGRSAAEYLKQYEYERLGEKAKAVFTDDSYRDELLSLAPALADELTWVAIWNAVKRETHAKHQGLNVNSKEFLRLAGDRFSQVIDRTQVYDSVLSRSAFMRSRSTYMSMVTSFMAEPTTTANMIESAARTWSKGNKKKAAGTLASAFVAVLLNSVLVSIVRAARDDDEDETYWEKYLGSFVSEIMDGVNPLTYLPFVRDIWSAFQGYDIERADMSIFSNIVSGLTSLATTLSKEDKDLDKIYELGFGVVGDIANVFGVPVKNIVRDVKALFNAVKTIRTDVTARDTTWGSLLDTAEDSMIETIPVAGILMDESRGDRLYDAILDGDQAYADRLKASYKDEDAVNAAVSKALRKNDSRVKEAALALGEEDFYGALEIIDEMIAEGNFTENDINAAVNAEYNKLFPAEEEESEEKAKTTMNAGRYVTAVINGKASEITAVKDEIIETAVKNGKTEKEAEKNLLSSAKTELKNRYIAGTASKQQVIASMKAIGADDIEETVNKWSCEVVTGTSYDDQIERFRSGDLTVSQFANVLTKYGSLTEDEAKTKIVEYSEDAYKAGIFDRSKMIGILVNYGGLAQDKATTKLQYWDYKNNHPDTYVDDSWIDKYNEEVESSGITLEAYVNYRSQVKSITGEGKKAGRMAVIDAMPITNEQKDALYYSEGWVASTIHEAPWH